MYKYSCIHVHVSTCVYPRACTNWFENLCIHMNAAMYPCSLDNVQVVIYSRAYGQLFFFYWCNRINATIYPWSLDNVQVVMYPRARTNWYVYLCIHINAAMFPWSIGIVQVVMYPRACGCQRLDVALYPHV
jgi:hypothetical protein